MSFKKLFVMAVTLPTQCLLGQGAFWFIVHYRHESANTAMLWSLTLVLPSMWCLARYMSTGEKKGEKK